MNYRLHYLALLVLWIMMTFSWSVSFGQTSFSPYELEFAPMADTIKYEWNLVQLVDAGCDKELDLTTTQNSLVDFPKIILVNSPGETVTSITIKSISINGVGVPFTPPFLMTTAGDAVLLLFDFTTNIGEGDTDIPITYYVRDKIAPSFVDPPADITYECVSEIPGTAIDVTDNCTVPGTINVQYEQTPSLLPDQCVGGTITREWIATDEYDNKGTFTQVIILNPDITKPDIPILVLPAAVGPFCSVDQVPVLTTVSALEIALGTDIVDGCTDDVDLDVSHVDVSDGSACPSVWTRTYTIEDACGNKEFVTQEITVNDTMDPVATATSIADGMSDCTAGILSAENQFIAWIDNVKDNPEVYVTDNCNLNVTVFDGATEITANPTSILASPCPNGVHLIKFVFSDACDNTIEKSATYTITDSTNPEVGLAANKVIQTCDEAVIQTELDAWLNSYGGTVATDFCSGIGSRTFQVGGVDIDRDGILATLMASFDTCEDPATIGSVSYDKVTSRVHVQFTFTDNCGHSGTSDAIFAIQDLTDPTFSVLPQNMTVECDGSGNVTELATWLSNNAEGTGTDDCTDITWTSSLTGTSPNDPCGNSSVATYTFVITDECGNTNMASADFIIQDTTPPVVDPIPSDITFECDGSGNALDITNWLTNNGGASASDCSSFTWTNDFVDLTDGCGITGDRVVTFTVTDDCDNSINVTATLTIEDTTDPVIGTVALNMEVECDGGGNVTELEAWLTNNGGADATDDCSGSSITWANDFTSLSNDCGMTGSATVVFTATDDCGKTATTSAIFKIKDTTFPTLNTAAIAKTVECDGAGNLAELTAWINNHGGALANPDVCGSINWTSLEGSNIVGACGNEREITYTFTAADDCGKSVNTTAIFYIEDTNGAVFFNVPADLTIKCGETIPDGIQGVTAVDICGGDVTVDIMVGQLRVNDNCPIPATGKFTNSWVVADACGNTAVAHQIITVIDDTAPVIEPGATGKSLSCDSPGLDAELQSWMADFAGAASMDECSNSVLSYEYVTNDDIPQSGTYPVTPVVTPGKCDWAVTVTFIATDECGNQSTSPAIFSLTDIIAPTFVTFPADMTITADAVCDFDITIVANDEPTVADNCDLNLTLTSNDSDDIMNPCTDFTINQITRTWTVSDACGNSTVQEQILTLQDNTAPTFTVPVDITVECELGIDPTVTGMVLIADDNCETEVVNGYEDTEALTVCGGSVTRLWTVSDACGNTSVGTQIITVVDTQAPILTVTEPMNFNCATADVDMNTAFVAWIENHAGATATDNCTPAEDITWKAFNGGTTDIASLDLFICFGYINHAVDFIAEDACGKITMFTEFFIVTDDTAPEFISYLEDVTITSSSDGLGDCQAQYSFAPPIITDGCSLNELECTPAYIPGAFVNVTSSSPNDPNVLVDPVTIVFVVAGPPTTANSIVSIRIDLYNVDGEANDPSSGNEVFRIIGEDGADFGYTRRPQNQCGNEFTTFQVSQDQFNQWAIDGLIEITLVPVNPGPGLEFQGINDICGGTTVGGSIKYECAKISNGFKLEYSLDGGITRVNVPMPIPGNITETFPVGENTLTFIATDCRGNPDTCSFKVTVEDDEPPVIANCTLSSLPATLPTTDCNPIEVVLPRPGGISDNCAVDSYDQTESAGLITFTEHPNIDGYVIDTMNVIFTSTIPPPATGLATLTVMFKGDIDNNDIGGNPARELFEIVGEDGVSLGITIAGPNCSSEMSVISVVNIPMNKLIEWSADGQIEISAYPASNNTFFGNDSDFENDDYGVNPCGAIDIFDVANPQIVSDGGNTAMSMQLVYSATNVSYSVSGATTIAETIFPIDGGEPTITINPGFNTIKYLVSDVYGNVDSTCTHTINVGSPSLTTPMIGGVTLNACIGELDTLVVTSTYIGTNPNWLWYEDIAPIGINNGEDILLETTQIPFKEYVVTDKDQEIYVIIQDNLCNSDKSGNTSISAGLNVIQPIIYISPNPICSGSDFGLYVDNPQVDWVSYTWTGPNGYTGSGLTPSGVSDASPVNSGEYLLTVINTSGCELTASTSVEVKGISTVTITSISYNPGDGGCVSGTDDLIFKITESPVDNNDEYTYIWSGPNGYSSNMKEAVVPNITTDDNGQYCITIFDETGCPSVQECIFVDIKDIPTTPELTISGSLTELCEGEAVTMNATVYSGSNDITYYWSTPNGLETTSVPSLIIDPIGTADAGIYSVFVIVDGCDSERSNELNMIVNPRPSTPLINGTSTICAGDSLILETPLVEGATYQWSGPNFTASVNKAVVYPASSINAGDYSVRIISEDGCPSDFSEIFVVTIEASPLVPVAKTSGSVCLDDNNAILSLLVENGTSGATYEWFDASTNVSIGTTTQTEYSITNLGVFTAGTYNFYVVATMPTGCTSAQSNIVSVDMNNIPSISAFAGDDINVCGNKSVNLDANMPTQGSGMWTQVSGPTATIADISSATTIINGLLDNSEYEFAWTLSNGSCTDFSSDNVKVVVNNANGVANAGINQELCDVTAATLLAVAAPTGNTGTWTQSTTQAALGGVILNPSNMTTEVTGLVPGNDYLFTWTLNNKGCGDYSTDVITISVFAKVTASLDQDVNLCGSVTVSGNTPGDCDGMWTSTNANIVFANPTSPVTKVNNLIIGDNTLRWTISCGNCGDTFDEIIVSYEDEIEANDDVFGVDFVNSTILDVGKNDQYDAGASFSIVEPTSNGTLTKNSDDVFTYLPDVSSDGVDKFIYEVCSANCPNECDQATVTIAVKIDTDCSIPTIITPNGDGYNDEFLIVCLRAASKYPSNSVTIFNEWGDQVFHASPYNNDWEGTYNNQDVPVGTYFYIVDFGDGSTPKSGFLLIER